jgi:hypothetical protein
LDFFEELEKLEELKPIAWANGKIKKNIEI